jgi:hypothetical protein
MRLPDRPAVEALERPFARSHVAEAAQPDEAVRIVEISELAEQVHAKLLLALDELTIEKLDQRLAAAGTERIAAKLDDPASVHRKRAAIVLAKVWCHFSSVQPVRND